MCDTTTDLSSFAGLRASGRTRRSIADDLAAGARTTVRRGVYAMKAVCAPALTAARHGGPLACVSAARHLGIWVLDAADEPVHVWLGAHGRSRAHADCACVTHWDALSPVREFALPPVEHVLRQILGCRGLEHFFVAVESAMHKGLITRTGIAWLRANTNDAARSAMDFARDDAESGLESLLRWRLRGRGLRVRSQVSIVSVGRVDFLIGDRLIIEVDGKVGHNEEPDRHKDRMRDANAAAWGYTTLRFDYAMVVHDWDTVELAILAQVDRGLHER